MFELASSTEVTWRIAIKAGCSWVPAVSGAKVAVSYVAKPSRRSK
jgi:hypothetical protein